MSIIGSVENKFTHPVFSHTANTSDSNLGTFGLDVDRQMGTAGNG